MNGKLPDGAAIGLALSVVAAMILLLVRPSLDPARVRWLPLLIGAWIAFIAAALAAAEGAAKDLGDAHLARAASPFRWSPCPRRRRAAPPLPLHLGRPGTSRWHRPVSVRPDGHPAHWTAGRVSLPPAAPSSASRRLTSASIRPPTSPRAARG